MPPIIAAVGTAGFWVNLAVAVAGTALSYGLQVALPARPLSVRLSTEPLAPRRPAVRG